VTTSAKPQSGPAPLTLLVGPEELLIDRAVAAVVRAARENDPDVEVRDLAPGTLAPGVLAELVSPSLFGGAKVMVIRSAQDLGKEVVAELTAYLAAPVDEVNLIVVHAGGAKGKALLDAVRKAKPEEIACAKLTKPGDKLAFVRHEFRSHRRTITEDAARALIDAVGGELRELASACSQLAADTEGQIDAEVVGRYYHGRAEATGFAVADQAVEGHTVQALEQLRWALSTGTAPVLISSALAQGVRSLAKLGAAPRGMRPADLARELGMPPWKVDRVRQQLRGWTGDGLAHALQAVAAADAEVKGAGGDPAYALEKAVVAITTARAKG